MRRARRAVIRTVWSLIVAKKQTAKEGATLTPAAAGKLVDELVAEKPRSRYGSVYGVRLEHTATGKRMGALSRPDQACVVMAAVEGLMRLEGVFKELRDKRDSIGEAKFEKQFNEAWNDHNIIELVVTGVLRRDLPF